MFGCRLRFNLAKRIRLDSSKLILGNMKRCKRSKLMGGYLRRSCILLSRLNIRGRVITITNIA